MEPGKGAFGPVGFHVGPQLVGKEAVGAREGLVETSEGRGHSRAARSKAGKLREYTDILWDDFLAKVRPYGVALALRTAEIQIADQRELGEGGGVPGRKRVAVGKGLVIQDGIAHEFDVFGGEGLAPFKLRVEHSPHIGVDVAELRGLIKGVQKCRDRGPVFFGLGAAGKLMDAVQRGRITDGFAAVLEKKGCGIANGVGAVEELLKGNGHTASYG